MNGTDRIPRLRIGASTDLYRMAGIFSAASRIRFLSKVAH